MPHSSTFERFRAEAAHALSRVRYYRQQGDAARAEQWYSTWSWAETAADAELREKGGGARCLRQKTPPPLRPLPEDVPPLALLVVPELPEVRSDPTPAVEGTSPSKQPAVEEEGVLPALDDALKAAMLRHAAIARALRDGGPNPVPGELDEGAWQYQLAAFRVDGPQECDLLQTAEAAVEALLESSATILPEPEDGTITLDPHGDLSDGMLPICIEIYRESLADLTEEELRADWITCLEAGRADTAALVEVELRRRERETGPDIQSFEPEEMPERPGVNATRGEFRERESPSIAAPQASSPDPQDGDPRSGEAAARPLDGIEPVGHSTPPSRRRRAAPYGMTPPPPTRAVPKEPPSPSSVDAATRPTQAEYTIAPAWIDTAGRTRTWSLFDPSGTKMAEIATKRDAQKLAALFNRLLIQDTPRSS